MAEKYRISYIKVVFLITAIALIVYSNSFGNQFVWDDKYEVEQNSFIRDWRFLPEIFTTDLLHFAPIFKSNHYRPLQTLSYMLDYSLWRLNPAGFHLSNLFLHILNAILIFFLLNRILKDRSIALITSLLFIVHPIHTEAVSYISGRADPLAGLFLLLALIFFIKYANYPAPKRNLYYLGSLFSFILALLSREIAIAFPILLLVYDHCFPAQARLSTGKRQSRIYPYLAFFIVDGLYIISRLTVLNFSGKFFSSGSNLYLRLLTMCKSIVVYIGLLFMPINLHMERKLPVAGSFFEPQILACVFLVLIAATFVWMHKKRQSIIYFGFLWFLVTLLPQSSLIFPKTIAEHFLYLPSIGIFLILTAMFCRFKRYMRLILIPLLVFYSTLTWAHNMNWRNSLTLFRWTIRYAPNSIKAHNNLGLHYEEKGLYERAVYEYRKALEIDPDYVCAHINLGNVYSKMDLFELAIVEYQVALKEAAKTKSHLAVVEGLVNAYDMVREGNLKNNSNIVVAINDNLMVVYDMAINEYEKELKSNPDSDILHYNLGVLYSRKGLIGEAISEYEKALTINPQFSKAYFNMGAIYANQGKIGEAIRLWEKTLKIDPNHKKARLSIEKAEEMYRLSP